WCLDDGGFEGEPARTLDRLGEFAGEMVRDQRGQPRSSFRNCPEHQAPDGGRLAPIRLNSLEREFDSRLERYEPVRASPDRCRFESVVADLLNIALGDDPARASGAAVEGKKVRPWLL